MSAEHTPSPFAHRFDQLATFENGRTPLFMLEADYNRARACWNACEGISTESLLSGHALITAFQREQHRADMAGRQRDELLTALQGLLAVVSVRIDDPRIAAFDAARAAIARADSSTPQDLATSEQHPA